MKKLFIASTLGLLSFMVTAQESTQLEPTDSLVLVNIEILDFDGIPESEASFTIESKELNYKKVAATDIEGKYQILLPKNKSFGVYIEKFGHTFAFDGKEKDKMTVPGGEGLNIFTQTFQIKLVSQYYENISLAGVNFDSGKWDIKPEYFNTLDKLANYLKENVRFKVEIGGHTDNVGDDKKNMTLSQRRCNAVREYLGKKGINPSRILPKGYGEAKPIADNATPDGRAKNRRLEAKVIEK